MNRPWPRLAGAAIAASVLLLASTGCGSPPDTSTYERVRETGILRIGYANEAPFAYQDSTTGELTGEAPAIVRLIAADLGITDVEGVLTEFGSLIPGLLAGRFDMIAAGMYVTPARCAQVAFSEPTYSIGEALIVPAGNPKGLHGYEDVRDRPDVTIGVVTGAIQREYARAMGVPDAQVLTFPDAPAALAGVRAGRVDSYAATELTVETLLDRAAPGLERAAPFREPVIDGRAARGYGAFAVRRDDGAWLAAINTSLGSFIGTDRHAELVAPFGFTDSMRPGPVTTEALCHPSDGPAG